MRKRICKVEEIVVRVTATGLARRIGQDEIVDLDDVLSKDDEGHPYTLGDAIAGREEELFGPDPSAPVPQMQTVAKPSRSSAANVLTDKE